MHSSNLRGTDFIISRRGQECSHAAYFAGFTNRRRLGLLAPDGITGVGAVTLVMAFVTAFYDTYRAIGSEFFAYPDYYNFQSSTPLTDYAMFDIWPQHKNVFVSNDQDARLNAINDRNINILLVPDTTPHNHEFQPAPLESARRNIDQCYTYSYSGTVADADLSIESRDESVVGWATSLFERGELGAQATIIKQKENWLAGQTNQPHLIQSYRTLTLTEALARL